MEKESGMVTCYIYHCTYGNEAMCKQDNVKIYMARLWSSMGTPVCENCLTTAVGYPPPHQYKPLYDYASGLWAWGAWSGKDDETAPVWNMGGIVGCSLSDLQAAAKGGKISLGL
jgi:hypothetical protein